jgi:hypothetical protein
VGEGILGAMSGTTEPLSRKEKHGVSGATGV